MGSHQVHTNRSSGGAIRHNLRRIGASSRTTGKAVRGRHTMGGASGSNTARRIIIVAHSLRSKSCMPARLAACHCVL